MLYIYMTTDRQTVQPIHHHWGLRRLYPGAKKHTLISLRWMHTASLRIIPTPNRSGAFLHPGKPSTHSESTTSEVHEVKEKTHLSEVMSWGDRQQRLQGTDRKKEVWILSCLFFCEQVIGVWPAANAACRTPLARYCHLSNLSPVPRLARGKSHCTSRRNSVALFASEA